LARAVRLVTFAPEWAIKNDAGRMVELLIYNWMAVPGG